MDYGSARRTERKPLLGGGRGLAASAHKVSAVATTEPHLQQPECYLRVLSSSAISHYPECYISHTPRTTQEICDCDGVFLRQRAAVVDDVCCYTTDNEFDVFARPGAVAPLQVRLYWFPVSSAGSIVLFSCVQRRTQENSIIVLVR
eukprot:SAG31_NODE_3217_length_4537_cov_1.607481_4_plen_146_part_00